MTFKMFFIINCVFFGFVLNSFAQQTEVDLSVRVPSDTPAVDNLRRINGICTSEDIGGVEIWIGSGGRLGFENFNNFTVSVIYEVEVPTAFQFSSARGDVPSAWGSRTGTIVLRANEQRETRSGGYRWGRSFALIVRRLQD